MTSEGQGSLKAQTQTPLDLLAEGALLRARLGLGTLVQVRLNVLQHRRSLAPSQRRVWF